MSGASMRLDFPYLVEDPDRHGNERYYVRMKGKPKIRLHAKFGTEAFIAEYWAARKIEPREAALLRKATVWWSRLTKNGYRCRRGLAL